MSTLVEQFDDLVSRRLATKRVSPDGKRAIYKYSKRVFYDYLWDESPLLAEARGIVLDLTTSEVVQYPFTKVYNYGEKGAGDDMYDDQVVQAVLKVNGFMAAVSIIDGELLITTSGSFESPFVEYAHEILAPHMDNLRKLPSGVTYVFEIVHPADPHIVVEEVGAYLIGARPNVFGSEQFSEGFLDEIAFDVGVRRPWWMEVPVSRLRTYIKTCTTEGVMVRDPATGLTICKWKSPYYLNLKFLSRSTYFLVEGFNRESLRQKVEEEMYPLIDFIYDVYGEANFKALPPYERVALLTLQLTKV